MKKHLIIFLILFASISIRITVLAQDDASASNSSSSDLPQSTFHINLLGLLQFGPVFMYESKMGAGNIYLAPYFRYAYAGVLTHLEWNADYVSPLNIGVGTQIKALSPIGTKNNAVFYGGGIEILVGSANYDIDSQYEKTGEYMGLTQFLLHNLRMVLGVSLYGNLNVG